MKIVYFSVILFVLSTFCFSQNPCPNLATVEYGGRTYNTVKIGSQCWLKENLDVGTMIMSSQIPSNNGVIEKYCYNNLLANCAIYGGMYQWDEAMQYGTTVGTQGICPTDWHIPEQSEFKILAAEVGNDVWVYRAVGPGNDANSSGFSALLAGYYGNNYFGLKDTGTSYWSSQEFSALNARYWCPGLADTSGNSSKNFGISIRCINNTTFSAVNEKSGLGIPEHYSLSQNFPNPFNPSTLIKFALPFSSEVKIEVYNILGNKVEELLNGQKNAGYYEINFNAVGLPSGVYFYTIKTSSIEGKQHFTSTKKMLILK